MRLADYLEAKNITRQKFAELIGVSDVAITRYLNGSRTPRREKLVRISQVTDGAVTPNDFISAPQPPARRRPARPARLAEAG